MLFPYGGPVPSGHAVHAAESAAWRAWAAMVYPRQAPLRLALDPAVGRALAELPADLVLVSSCAPAELEPLLPALGWESVPPLVPLRETGSVHYLRVEDPGRRPDAGIDLRYRTEEIVSWARTMTARWRESAPGTTRGRAAPDPRLPVGGRAGPRAPRRPGRRAHGRRPGRAAGVGAGDGSAAGAGPGGAAPVPGLRGPVHVRDGRRVDRVHARCGSCCECWCPAPGDDKFQPCGDLMREQCPDCRCCRNCVGCHCGE